VRASSSRYEEPRFDVDHDTLITASDVAKICGASKSWVLDHASGRRKPVIPRHKIGKLVRFSLADVNAFLERCRRATADGVPIQ
jgi:predicted DNA-binding transcriptional regulator AlpA